jgi:hypothetical protein
MVRLADTCQIHQPSVRCIGKQTEQGGRGFVARLSVAFDGSFHRGKNDLYAGLHRIERGLDSSELATEIDIYRESLLLGRRLQAKSARLQNRRDRANSPSRLKV